MINISTARSPRLHCYSSQHWYKHHPICRFKGGTKAPEVQQDVPHLSHLSICIELHPPRYFRSDCLGLGSPASTKQSRQLIKRRNSPRMIPVSPCSDQNVFNLPLITSQLRYTHIFFSSLVLVFLWSPWLRRKMCSSHSQRGWFALRREGSVQPSLTGKLRSPVWPPSSKAPVGPAAGIQL